MKKVVIIKPKEEIIAVEDIDGIGAGETKIFAFRYYHEDIHQYRVYILTYIGNDLFQFSDIYGYYRLGEGRNIENLFRHVINKCKVDVLMFENMAEFADWLKRFF